MMRPVFVLLLWSFSVAVRAEPVVIVHRDSPIEMLTSKEVADLYLGRARGVFVGSPSMAVPLVVFDHPADSALREQFFRRLLGIPLRQVNAYWARLRFSGEVLPPAVMADSHQVLEQVRRQPNALGFIESEFADNSVRIVLRLRD